MKTKPSAASAKRSASSKATPRTRSHGKDSYQIQSLKDADNRWITKFKRQGIKAPRLLVVNDSPSGDRLTSLVIHLGIRSDKRIYVADPPSGQSPDLLRRAYSRRMDAAAQSPNNKPRLLDAQIIDGHLKVTSTAFDRLEVALARIPALAQQPPASTSSFEIDEEGAYLYWPDADVHLGWEQLVQITNPAAALKAKQKSTAFNQRYGAAIRAVRQAHGVDVKAVPGLSSRQLTRIEAGECRMTSAAAAKLAKAHGMDPNQYLSHLAAALKTNPARTA